MVRLRWLQTHDPPQNQQRLFFSSLPLQIFQRIFIGPDRQLLVGLLQQLPEAYFLFPGRIGIARQLFISQAGSRGIRRRYLPLKQLSHQLHRLRSLIQRETQVRRHLPHIVVLRIAFQNLQVFRQRVGRLPFCRSFSAFSTRRAISARLGFSGMGGLWADRGSALILGFAPGPSNALRPPGDYESHAIVHRLNARDLQPYRNSVPELDTPFWTSGNANPDWSFSQLSPISLILRASS